MRREDELLLMAVRSQCGGGPSSGMEEIVHAGPDWNYLAGTAWSHGVLPLLYRTFANYPGLVDPRVMERLRRTYHQQGLLSRIQVGELHEVLELFAGEGIQALVFKGAALAVQGYGNPAFRKPGDLDLLIRKEHFSRARALLQENGFHPHVHPDLEKRYLEGRGGSVMTRGTCHVDLHWTLEQQRFDSLPFSFRLSMDDLWSDSIHVDLAGRKIRTLSPEHHLLFVCFHGTKHFWQKLYLVCDVAGLLRTYPDLPWQNIVEAANRMRILRMLYLGLLLAHGHLGAPVPRDVLEAAAGDEALRQPFRRADALLFGEDTPDLSWHLFRLSMLESVPEKMSYVFNRGMRKVSKLGIRKSVGE